ncbi:MAG: hypothetical protein Q7J02_08585 [Rhodocyclaceae bacterium]|nr:hypothetical protein [Rhodocyclaceae bacterium]
MSELQIALIGFGALLVVVVWGYNLWQARKQRRMAQAVFPDAQPDVLMAGRAEPEVVAVPREPTLMAPHARNPGSLPPTGGRRLGTARRRLLAKRPHPGLKFRPKNPRNPWPCRPNGRMPVPTAC